MTMSLLMSVRFFHPIVRKIVKSICALFSLNEMKWWSGEVVSDSLGLSYSRWVSQLVSQSASPSVGSEVDLVSIRNSDHSLVHIIQSLTLEIMMTNCSWGSRKSALQRDWLWQSNFSAFVPESPVKQRLQSSFVHVPRCFLASRVSIRWSACPSLGQAFALNVFNQINVVSL